MSLSRAFDVIEPIEPMFLLETSVGMKQMIF